MSRSPPKGHFIPGQCQKTVYIETDLAELPQRQSHMSAQEYVDIIHDALGQHGGCSGKIFLIRLKDKLYCAFDFIFMFGKIFSHQQTGGSMHVMTAHMGATGISRGESLHRRSMRRISGFIYFIGINIKTESHRRSRIFSLQRGYHASETADSLPQKFGFGSSCNRPVHFRSKLFC